MTKHVRSVRVRRYKVVPRNDLGRKIRVSRVNAGIDHRNRNGRRSGARKPRSRCFDLVQVPLRADVWVCRNLLRGSGAIALHDLKLARAEQRRFYTLNRLFRYTEHVHADRFDHAFLLRPMLTEAASRLGVSNFGFPLHQEPVLNEEARAVLCHHD